MRSDAPRYPVDRYLVESSKKFEMVNIIDDDIWNPEPGLKPEDEIILRKLHEMLQSTADDLKLLSGEMSKFHEPGIQVKSAPTPLDEEFNEKVHIEEVVNAKFHGYKIIEKPLNIPEVKPRNDTIDGVKVKHTAKVINADVKVNAIPISTRPVIRRNLGITRTRLMQINGKDQDSVKNEKLNNGKVMNCAPTVAYNEFCFKYVEPKVKEIPRKKLQVQDMPSINIRSELKEQKVLHLDIVPESNEAKDIGMVKSNVSVVEIKHDTLPKQVPVKPNESVKFQKISNNNQTVRKTSKMSTCESSGSANNLDSDDRAREYTQKRIISAMRNSPQTLARERVKKNTMVKKETDKRARFNLDEWKKKLHVVYGSSNSKKTKMLPKRPSPKKTNVIKRPTSLNNAEYIPYSQLTLGGVKVSDIEREISDLPKNNDMPLSPILDKILSSRENSFHKESPRIHHPKDDPIILTTSDENLLQEVIDIERSVSETLSKNLKKINYQPVIKSQNVSRESNNGAEENESYADDFEDEKSEHSGKSDKQLPSDEEPYENSIKENDEEKSNDSSENYVDDGTYGEPVPGPSEVKNTTYTKTSNLSFKDSVDIFEFVHLIDTHDSATQSNGTNKIVPQETQTSPRNGRPYIQPIHNDLWSPIDPRREVEKMFELEKDFIKRLIIDEYGDLLEKNINKPSTSNENKQDERKKNITALQKNTQTSPAHVKSVMTSPRKTKTRTTSPFHLSVPVNQRTSPMILVTNEDEEINDIGIEADDISVNLSSPRFSLRLPQTSHEVLSNLGDQSRPHSKVEGRDKLKTKTFTKSTVASSSSVDADNYSSSETSSLGEVKVKRSLRKRVPSISECSSSTTIETVSQYNYNLQSISILPLRSEGEVSLGQTSRKKIQKPINSDGETSFGHLFPEC